LHEEKKKISLNIECIGKLTLDGYHTKWYKHYKRAVSTDRDSEMESNEEGGVVVPARDETDNEERHPFVDKTSHGQYSSELEARAHAFWNVLERQLLVWLRVLVEVKSAHRSHPWTGACSERRRAVCIRIIFMSRKARGPCAR
jgi:hypothetical protein